VTTYRFDALSPADFEDLARDAVSLAIERRLEGFKPGPDGGIDGRFAGTSGNEIVLQAKHFSGSTFAQLKAAMRKEVPAIRRIAPARYILATSMGLTPKNKADLIEVAGPWMRSTADIFGATEITSLVSQNPKLINAHVKLWLSSADVLESIFRAVTRNVTGISKDEIADKVKVYAENASFSSCSDVLRKHHVVIISGPPGVGKTTLAQMLSYAFLAEDWELVSILNLDQGLAELRDDRKQVFYFDDFLGQISIDARSLSSQDASLAKFIKKIQRSPNARFILTTRAHILEEARRLSEHLSDPGINLTKFLLDVGVYTRRVRARILYNHLYVSRAPREYVEELVRQQAYKEIIDHKNYNPRIIEWMTDPSHLQGIDAGDYVRTFIATLDNPSRLWDIAFRNHISQPCQFLLIARFFLAEYATNISDLKAAYQLVGARLSREYGSPLTAKSFEESLRVLEGGFVAIRGQDVSYINPSLRDYLSTYLADVDLLIMLAELPISAGWQNALWRYVTELNLRPADVRVIAARLESQFHATFFRRILIGRSESASRRVQLAIEVWRITRNDETVELVCKLLDQLTYIEWADARNIAYLVEEMNSGEAADLPESKTFVEALRSRMKQILETSFDLEVLGSIEDIFAGELSNCDEALGRAFYEAVERNIEALPRLLDEYESVSQLDELMDEVASLTRRSAALALMAEDVLARIQIRRSEIEATTDTFDEPTGGASDDRRDVTDAELESLFGMLAT
jgi:hypothetical protein